MFASFFLKAIRALHTIYDCQQIQFASYLLKMFKETLAEFYHEQIVTYNFHVLNEHLINDATIHGSISQHSMFSLESSLGYFKRALHGNRGISNQIIESKVN